MTVQNHIHLDLPGVPHDADGAPLAKWTVTNLEPKIVIQVNVKRGLTGHTFVGRVTDSNNNAVIHEDVSLTLRCSASELDYLKSLVGNDLEYVPNDHVADGVDHSSYIVNVVMTELNARYLDPMLRKWDVSITLVDKTAP